MSSTDNFVEVYNALKARGIDVYPEGVPMICTKSGQHGYSPNGQGSWLVIHDDDGAWKHLVTHDDPKVIAEAIHAHFSATNTPKDAY
jgi:hypothetical protein